ncbi:hypothetical protein M9Y10_006297 [Tritrichomonas musculus]|uniref:Initiator binding domain-containing protein n=1 Tax=Tritrichomonas musculus TaxID=1915356 RepID=A0ABR2JDU2_9EUKA
MIPTTNRQNAAESVFLNMPINEFLSKEDYDYYQNLQNILSSHICRNCRNRRVESFNEILSAIRYFVDRTNQDIWKRCLICGVCWHKNYICVNIRRLSEFLGKCKSSVNGSLQRLYLNSLQNKQQSFKILTEAIPYLKNHQDQLKMWSVRQFPYNSQIYNSLMASNQVTKQKSDKLHRNTQKKSQKYANLDKNSQNGNSENKADLKQEISSKPVKIEKEAENNFKDSMDLFREIDLSEGIFD